MLYWLGAGSDSLAESTGATLTAEYIFFGGKRVARLDNPGPSETAHYYISDHLGSATVIATAAGAVERETMYFPYGGERWTTGSDPNHYKFTGKERDAETGLDYFGARYYGSTMGRFTSADPMLNSGQPWNPQSWNRYAYTFNNPLKFVDPSGLYEWAPNSCNSNDKNCNKKYQKNQQNFRNALKKLEKARDSFKKGSKEYNRLDAALKSYGTENVHNGVYVAFGELSGDDAGLTTPQKQNTEYLVTFDMAKIDSGNEFAEATGHEGTHVSDFSSALYTTGAGGYNLFNMEYRGYQTTSWVAQGVGDSTRMLNGFEIWNPSWAAADRGKMRDFGITGFLGAKDAEVFKRTNQHVYTETQFHDPWPN